MMGDKSKVFRCAALLYIFVLISGCETSHIQPAPNMIPPSPLFPPQAVMQTGDYENFLAENYEALKSCQDPDKCTAALFNISFVYCYAKSPYYDPQQGLKYIDDLIAASPGNQWTFQAMVWKALIEKNMKEKVKKRPAARGEPKGKEALEDEISSKEEIIKELNRQLERSRQIDIEMEQKQRGLLH